LFEPTAFLIEQVLERFGLLEGSHRGSPLSGKPLLSDTSLAPLSVDEIQSYAAMVGCLQYLACVSRPDLTFAASQLACYMAKPTREHLIEAKRALRYLASTRKYKLSLGGAGPLKAVIYSDADFANCPVSRRSITGYVMMLGDSPVAWASRRQPIITKSTTAA
jgi:hypothetical protein